MNVNRWLTLIVIVLALQVAGSLRLAMGAADITEQIGRVLRHVEPPGSIRGADVGVDTTRPYLGNPEAPVHMVIFADFQCPACAHLAPMISQLAERFGDSLCVSFRNNPLPMHDRARRLATLGLAAWDTGAFWNFHDSLFAYQGQLDDATLARWCQSMGIRPLTESAIEKMIEEDRQLAEQLDIKATPTIFVNGRRIIGAYPLSVFERIVSEELAAPNQRPMMCEN